MTEHLAEIKFEERFVQYQYLAEEAVEVTENSVETAGHRRR